MKEIPNKIYIDEDLINYHCLTYRCDGDLEYIRKDALLEWAENELERLYELIPDAHKVEDETATSMEMRYLGQYMQMESVIDKLDSL